VEGRRTRRELEAAVVDVGFGRCAGRELPTRLLGLLVFVLAGQGGQIDAGLEFGRARRTRRKPRQQLPGDIGGRRLLVAAQEDEELLAPARIERQAIDERPDRVW